MKTIKSVAKMINEKKLNLACGQIRVDDFFGIDLIKTDAVDAVVNLEEFPWPIEDNSVEEILCSHYVEHTSDLIKFMDECFRIMKPPVKNEDGSMSTSKMKIVAPYYTSIRCWQDPTHKRAISDATFLYFNKGWRDANKLDHYGIKADFDFSYGYDINPNWASKHEEARNYAITHYWNVVNDIHVTLVKR